jgi:hypothetical protein
MKQPMTTDPTTPPRLDGEDTDNARYSQWLAGDLAVRGEQLISFQARLDGGREEGESK